MQTSRLYPYAGTVCANTILDKSKHLVTSIRRSSVQQDGSAPLKSWKEIPGPRSVPILGPLLNFIPGVGSIGKKLGLELSEYFYKTYGPIVKLDAMLGRPTFIFLFDPEASAQVLRSENSLPVRPGFQSLEYFRKNYYKSKNKTLSGLISDHGEEWKTVRSVVNPVMLKRQNIDMYRPVLHEVAQDMVNRIKSLRDENNMVTKDMDIEMNKWSLESIGVISLGGRIGCLDPNLAEDSPARKLIQCVHDIFITSQKLDFEPSIWQYYPTKTFKQAMELYKEQFELSKYFINRAIKDIENKKGNTDREESVLEKLLKIDEDIAVVMATDMLFAGVDTAATSMLSILFLLATNPEAQNKLREELMSQPEKTPYLKACIKESMRLMPVVAGNMRQTTKEYALCGYSIPKNVNIIFSHQFLSIMESQYVRANEFLPERWLVPKTDPLHHSSAHPFAMSPFGFGVRQCIGKMIASLELEILLTKIIQNFKLEWKGGPLQVKPSSLNYVVGPYNYVFKDV